MCPNYKGRTTHGRVNRRGRFNGRPNAAPLQYLSTLNKCTFAPAQIPPVSGAKHNGAGIDLVLNYWVAYLGFGRYWQLIGR
jgi:hypothetical protein